MTAQEGGTADVASLRQIGVSRHVVQGRDFPNVDFLPTPQGPLPTAMTHCSPPSLPVNPQWPLLVVYYQLFVVYTLPHRTTPLAARLLPRRNAHKPPQLSRYFSFKE